MPTTPKPVKLTEPQLRALRWAKQKYSDGRVPSFAFNSCRSSDALLRAGVIEYWIGYGGLMYRFTQLGLDTLDKTP